MLKVVVIGAAGKMGSEVVKAVMADQGTTLVGMVETSDEAIRALDVNEALNEVYRSGDLQACIDKVKPDVAIDFTHPASVFGNVLTCIKSGVNAVVGTTGMTPEQMSEIGDKSLAAGVSVAVIPNFAIGAVLLMKCSELIAKHMPNVEIIELHHDKKADAPSGTAIKTAQLISKSRTEKVELNDIETYPGARGAKIDDIYVHSVRLPGLFAHEEVIFSAAGQTLTLRHDTFNRECYMPGVIAAVKAVSEKKGLTYGLEQLLDI